MTSSRKCTSCHPDERSDSLTTGIAATPRSVVQPRKKALLNRMSRISGQVNGISQMIEQDRYCVDILNQISAARSALNAAANQLLADHANGCVRNAVLEDGGEEAIAELLQVIQRMR